MTMLWCGHAPTDIDAMPVRDLLLFLDALPVMTKLMNGHPTHG